MIDKAEAEEALHAYQNRRCCFDRLHPDCTIDEAMSDLSVLASMLPRPIHVALWDLVEAPARQQVDLLQGTSVKEIHDAVRDVFEAGLARLAGHMQ